MKRSKKKQREISRIMKLINNPETQLSVAMSMAKVSSLAKFEREGRHTNHMHHFVGSYSNCKKPRSSALPMRIILKHMSEEEYFNGYISDKTKGIIINNLNLKRSALKKKLKKNKKDTRARNEISKTKVPIYNSISKTFNFVLDRAAKRSKASVSKIVKSFRTRSLCQPITIANDAHSLIYSDLIDGEEFYQSSNTRDGKHSFIMNNTNIAVAYVGDNIHKKTARVLFGLFRPVSGNLYAAAYGTTYNDIAIIDSIGSIRQQKRIINKILSLMPGSGLDNLYIPSGLTHRFRCDFEFSKDKTKLIDPYITITKAIDPSGKVKKSEYPNVDSHIFSGQGLCGNRNYIIHEACEIAGPLKPKPAIDTPSELVDGDRKAGNMTLTAIFKHTQ